MKTATKLFQMSVASIAVMGLGMTSVASAHSNTYKHYNHYNPITMRCEISNENDIEIDSEIKQEATSGDVVVENNTTVDNIKTGNTVNTQTSGITTEIDNSAAIKNLDKIITQMQPQVNNHDDHHDDHKDDHHHDDKKDNHQIKPVQEVEIKNENDVEIKQEIEQTATSGNIVVTDNTTVGDVTTGFASNTSTSTINVSIK